MRASELHAFIICALLVFCTTATPAACEDLRVVIDASKDGGLWWFPQWQNFNSNELHQGQQFADYLRGRGCVVVELPQRVIVRDQFKGADIVVRVSNFTSYNKDEVHAYLDYVEQGGSLLLVGGAANARATPDAVAEAFGIEFAGVLPSVRVSRWADEPFLDRLPAIWLGHGRLIKRWPTDFTPLGWDGEENVVLGVMPYHHGKLIALSVPWFFQPHEESAPLVVEYILNVLGGLPLDESTLRDRSRAAGPLRTRHPLDVAQPNWTVRAPEPPRNGPVIAHRVTTRGRSFSRTLADTLVIGLPMIAALGAVVFTVRTVRSVPQHRRTLAFGLMSASVSLFALSCSAMPFVPPRLCALLALGVSAFGTVLALFGFREREQAHAIWPCVFGLAANAGVQLLAFSLLMPNSVHLIDRLEHRSKGLLEFINLSALTSVLSIVGIRVWLWLSQRNMRGQRFQFSLSSLLLISAAIPIWLRLFVVLPGLFLSGGRKQSDLGDLIGIIREAPNFGVLGTFAVLITPLVLYAVTVAVHPLVSRRRDAWPLSALLAGLIVTIVLLVLAWAQNAARG